MSKRSGSVVNITPTGMRSDKTRLKTKIAPSAVRKRALFRSEDISNMSRRKGELSAGEIDRGWPFQVALPSDVGMGLEGQAAMSAFCKKLLRCNRGHSVFHEDQHYNVHCFAVKAHAEAFMAEFGGEWCDPKERGKGANWNRWNKGSLAGG